MGGFRPVASDPPAFGDDGDRPRGQYFRGIGQRYQEILARNGIDSAGAFCRGRREVARLRDPKSGISVGIIPSGITNQQQSRSRIAGHAVLRAPLVLRPRNAARGETRRALQGLRISVGPEGSGTHALSVEFLARIGIIDQSSANCLRSRRRRSREAAPRRDRRRGHAGGWESPAVRQLLAAAASRSGGFPRADAFVALYPFLNKVVLPAGRGRHGEEPAADRCGPGRSQGQPGGARGPASGNPVPAAQSRGGDPLADRACSARPDEFPAARVDRPAAEQQCAAVLQIGPPFLQRHFPFWLAVLVQQLLVVLIPVLPCLYPLLRFLPALYGWAMRRRVFRLYGELKFLEDELGSRSTQEDVADLVARLDRLENRCQSLPPAGVVQAPAVCVAIAHQPGAPATAEPISVARCCADGTVPRPGKVDRPLYIPQGKGREETSLFGHRIDRVCVRIRQRARRFYLRTRLPEHHLSEDSLRAVSLAIGLIATLAALVLGLLTASAKSSFDKSTMTSGKSRPRSSCSTARWPTTARRRRGARNAPQHLRVRHRAGFLGGWFRSGETGTPQRVAGLEKIQSMVRALTPQNDSQRWLQARALDSATT